MKRLPQTDLIPAPTPILIRVFFFCCTFQLSQASPVPITSVPEIRRLTPGVAEQGLPVAVKGIVLWHNPFSNAFFMQSGEAGIYVSQPGHQSDPVPVQQGTIVQVKGATRKGTYAPSIRAEIVKPLGTAALPKARQFLAFETYSTTIDCDWVSLRGRILSMRVYRTRGGGPRAVLQVESRDVYQNVLIPLTDGTEEKIRALMFRRVRFNAVVTTLANTSRQALGRAFYVNAAEDFVVIDEPEPLDGRRLLEISELMATGIDPRAPVRIRGWVTHVTDRDLYLRGEQSCIKATTREKTNIEAGGYVELEGVVLPDPVSPAFLAREVQLIDQREVPGPVQMEINDALWERWAVKPDTRLHQELVQVEARLVDVGESYGRTPNDQEQLLLCRQGGRSFTVKLPMEIGNLDLMPGSLLRITGICTLTRSGEPDWRLQVDGFWIQPRSATDVVVIAAPPWWNTKRLLWAFGILAAIVVLISVWVVVLRRTLRAQTDLIAVQVGEASVLNERQRIARELHDTLEQGLTALKLQLKLIHREVETGLPGELPVVEVAETMLEVCSRESRASIEDLRGGLLEEMDLPSAIRQTVELRLNETDVKLQMNVAGDVQRLTLFAEHQVLRLVMEAVANAVQHGAPTTISIRMQYGNQLQVEIRDDGCGFDPRVAEASGRFGLLGMHERANRLHGELQVESREGEGCCIRLNLPVFDFVKEKRV